jgi:acyl carrier protein
VTDATPTLTADEVEQDLRALIADLAELDPTDLGVDIPFPDVGIDSLMAMEIAVHVEARYGVHFEEGDVKSIQTIGQMTETVLFRSPPEDRA